MAYLIVSEDHTGKIETDTVRYDGLIDAAEHFATKVTVAVQTGHYRKIQVFNERAFSPLMAYDDRELAVNPLNH